MTTPTLPGTIPGLLRRCSPVLAPVSKRVRAIGRRAIVIGEHLDSGGVLLADGAIEAYEDLALDLSDPTGRAHAAWWLEAQPVWSNVYRRSEGAWWFGERFGIPYLGSGSFCAAARPRRAPWDFRWAVIVPSLANLVDDGRLLPDGSRWVDAEALRLVCLHVAGVSRV